MKKNTLLVVGTVLAVSAAAIYLKKRAVAKKAERDRLIAGAGSTDTPNASAGLAAGSLVGSLLNL